MRNTVIIMLLVILIGGELAVKAYYDFSAQLLKTFANLTPIERANIISAVALKSAKTETGNPFYQEQDLGGVIPVSDSRMRVTYTNAHVSGN